MKVFVTGGTGFVGTLVTRHLLAQGYEVTVLTRSMSRAAHMPEGAVLIEGDPTEKGAWQKQVSEHEVIINLAGSSIFTRWTKSARQRLRESRLKTTRNLVEALAQRRGQETLLLSTSAVGYYGFRGDEILDENSAGGDDFLAILARDWEKEAFRAKQLGVRVVACRFGTVLGKGGGALDKMVKPFRMGLGARFGKGTQWFSWIHQQDLLSIYSFLIGRKDISGPINFTAPEPVTNDQLTRTLARVLRKSLYMPPVPGFMLRLILGEFGSVLLKGQRVLPRRLMSLGFKFQFPTIMEALSDLLS